MESYISSGFNQLDSIVGGLTYITEYFKSLPKEDVKLIVAKNRNTCKCETAHLFYNRSNRNCFE